MRSAEAVPKLIAHNHMVWLYAFYPHALYLFAYYVKFVHWTLLMAKEKGIKQIALLLCLHAAVDCIAKHLSYYGTEGRMYENRCWHRMTVLTRLNAVQSRAPYLWANSVYCALRP